MPTEERHPGRQGVGVTHSAVSQHIHRLEEGLDTTLFVRRVPDMVPTPTALAGGGL
uniref:LysR family transcriptional regulator n=1 Tax=Phenylobacterium glaciei TaxID=2803784 RepID=A0A974P2U0_9CAUL|nr:LysR family transcriptional regulator [Phenylobacterium glaciei]